MGVLTDYIRANLNDMLEGKFFGISREIARWGTLQDAIVLAGKY